MVARPWRLVQRWASYEANTVGKVFQLSAIEIAIKCLNGDGFEAVQSIESKV
jgi:hypothetical protein